MANKHTVNKDLKRIEKIEKAVRKTSRNFVPTGLAFIFLLIILYTISYITGGMSTSIVMMVAGVLGGYMALNIGANDVANNVGPAVGSKALTMAGALAIAAIFEVSGSLVAGGNVVNTISHGIISPGAITNSGVFILLMLSALLSAALWLNLATYLGAPVSTTHSIVGGVIGAGIVAAGFNVVHWVTMGSIVLSWVISPVMGGVIAALFFKFIKVVILSKDNKLAAAKRWVPLLVSILTAAFTVFIMSKGLKHIWKPDTNTIWLTGVIILFAMPLFIRPFISASTGKLDNSAKSVNTLFTLPLIFSAAMLSFAHGANDVANAVGPLAAIVGVAKGGSVTGSVSIPIWVMMIGGFGISVGLILFGPHIIKRVGEEITKLDQVRAFCISLSAAITVILASELGLPVSSTHIAVGGIFGVGFYREYSSHKRRQKALEVSEAKLNKRMLVRRQHMMSIAAAWVITVPCAAVLSAIIYLIGDHFHLTTALM